MHYVQTYVFQAVVAANSPSNDMTVPRCLENYWERVAIPLLHIPFDLMVVFAGFPDACKQLASVNRSAPGLECLKDQLNGLGRESLAIKAHLHGAYPVFCELTKLRNSQLKVGVDLMFLHDFLLVVPSGVCSPFKQPEHPEHLKVDLLEPLIYGASSGVEMFRYYRNIPERRFL